MARTLRHPATIMLLVGLAVLGLALCCLGGSVAFTALAADASGSEPPAAAIVSVVIGVVAFAVGVIGACFAAVVSRRATGRDAPAPDLPRPHGMSDPTA